MTQPLTQWLEHGEAVQVTVSGRDLQPTRATIYRKELNLSERRKRALKGLLICWLLALLSLPILFLHFILVPAFFVSGVVLFKLKVSEHGMILGGAISCPACNKEFNTSAQSEEWPLGVHCEFCGKGLELRPEMNDNE